MVWIAKVFCILIVFVLYTSCGTNSSHQQLNTNKEKKIEDFAIIYTGRWDTLITDTLFVEKGNKISHIDILNLFENRTSKKCFTKDSLQFKTMISDTIGIIHYHQFNEWSYSAYFYNPIGVFYIVRNDFPTEYYVGYYSGINSTLLDSLLVLAKSDHINRMNEMLNVIEVNSIETSN
jgi:hypothetical protein